MVSLKIMAVTAEVVIANSEFTQKEDLDFTRTEMEKGWANSPWF